MLAEESMADDAAYLESQEHAGRTEVEHGKPDVPMLDLVEVTSHPAGDKRCIDTGHPEDTERDPADGLHRQRTGRFSAD